MIHTLDHIAVAATPPDAAAEGYRLVLGRRPDRRTSTSGVESFSIQLANMRLELGAATASTAAGEGLSALAFAVRDLERARHLLDRRALPTSEPDAAGLVRVAPSVTHQVPISLMQRPEAVTSPPSALMDSEESAAAAGLDHVVIRSPNPERAVALYAGRLGLSLRLDRSEPAWGARLLFFRCGDLIVEVAHDLKAGIGDGPDRLWGLSWRMPDLVKGHARLRAGGVDVSDIRVGRRPHTKVFMVKSHTAGVPTLMLGPDPKQIVLPSHPLADA